VLTQKGTAPYAYRQLAILDTALIYRSDRTRLIGVCLKDDGTGDGTLHTGDGAVQSDDGTGDGTAHKCVKGRRRIPESN